MVKRYNECVSKRLKSGFIQPMTLRQSSFTNGMCIYRRIRRNEVPLLMASKQMKRRNKKEEEKRDAKSPFL